MAILYTSMRICDFSAVELKDEPELLRVDSDDAHANDDVVYRREV